MADMKFIVWLIFVIFIAPSMFITIVNATSSNPIGTTHLAGVTVSDETYYEPHPGEPGGYIDLWITVTNKMMETATNVICEIDPEFPFSIDPTSEPERDIGNINSLSSMVLKYKIRIDVDAVEGENDLRFRCRSGSVDYQNVDLPIYIQTHDAIIDVEKVESVPQKFKPGETGRLDIYLKNLADSLLMDITIELNLSSNDIPFAPINSTIKKRIKNIGSGEEAITSFGIISYTDAESGVYKIPLEITYSDEVGADYSDNTIVSLTVFTPPDIMIILEDFDVYTKNTTGKVSIEVINKGDSDVKFLTIELEKNGDYEILSTSKIYSGKIKSDSAETVNFDLYIKNEGEITLPVTVSYQDEESNYYTKTEKVKLKIYSSEEGVLYKLIEEKTTDPILLGIAALIGLWILYKIVKGVWKGFKKK